MVYLVVLSEHVNESVDVETGLLRADTEHHARTEYPEGGKFITFYREDAFQNEENNV